MQHRVLPLIKDGASTKTGNASFQPLSSLRKNNFCLLQTFRVQGSSTKGNNLKKNEILQNKKILYAKLHQIISHITSLVSQFPIFSFIFRALKLHCLDAPGRVSEGKVVLGKDD